MHDVLKKYSITSFLIVLTSLTLYCFNRFILKINFPSNLIIQGYVSDLLVMPLIFSLINIANTFFRIRLKIENNIFYYLSIFLVCSWVFEILRAKVVKGSTTDVWDAFCYLIGTLIYIFIYNKTTKKIV